MSNMTVEEDNNILNTVQSIYSSLNTIILYSGLIIELLWFIMFIYRIFKKDSTFITPYYILLLIGYFVNIIPALIFIPSEILKTKFKYIQPLPVQIIYNIFYWYMWRFMGPWNTVLALNRFTGMFFYKKHGKIWKKLNFKIIIILLLLYPFILSSPYLGLFIHCIPLEYNQKECIDFWAANVSYSNLANGIISLVFGISTALARKIRGQNWTKKQKFETYLLIQSIVSTLFLCISEGSVILRLAIGIDNINNAVKYIFVATENWFGQFFYCSSAVMIFCLSKTIRQSFISFYRIYFIPGIKNPARNQITSINSLTN